MNKEIIKNSLAEVEAEIAGLQQLRAFLRKQLSLDSDVDPIMQTTVYQPAPNGVIASSIAGPALDNHAEETRKKQKQEAALREVQMSLERNLLSGSQPGLPATLGGKQSANAAQTVIPLPVQKPVVKSMQIKPPAK